MIILEGTDHVGKTTFAKLLCGLMSAHFGGEVGGHYSHMSKPREDFDHLSGYFGGIGPVVQDRYHLGSLVYGRILRKGTFPSARRMRIVQAYLNWRGCITVIFTCQRDVLAKRLAESVSKEEMYRADQILDAGDAYYALTKSTNDGEPYCDFHIDVTDKFPGEKEAENIFGVWKSRFLR